MEKIATVGIDLVKQVFALPRSMPMARLCCGARLTMHSQKGVRPFYLFGPLKLGRLDERHMRIEDEYSRLKRKNV